MFYQLTKPTGSTAVKTTQLVRDALEKACQNPGRPPTLPPLQVVTTDHYNTKWAVVAIEWLRRRKIADHILNRPRRVCIEVLEAGVLPRGRFLFYNGVGGALADMIAHLIQPLRALTGEATVKDLLGKLRIVEMRRARYNVADDLVLEAFGSGIVNRDDLALKLAKDTETFGVIKLEFTGSPWNGTPIYIRTGKGFLPQSKTIVVEGSDDDGPTALICDIDNRHIRLAVPRPRAAKTLSQGDAEESDSQVHNRLPDYVWMQSQEVEIPGLSSGRPLSTRSREYVEVFSALCHWETPDPRFFPPVEEAASACDFFYRYFLRDRAAYPQGLDAAPDVYEANYVVEELRQMFAASAGWR